MNCVNADGTLNPDSQYLMAALEDPMTIQDVSVMLDIPMVEARSKVWELVELRLVKCRGDKYQLDSMGIKKLLELSLVLL